MKGETKMKRHSWRLRSVIYGFGFFFASAVAALAAEKAPFYQGKTLNIIINFGAGGPTDI
jgi:tripartite-type tricarboxylate transporter receptor subunit TctC